MEIYNDKLKKNIHEKDLQCLGRIRQNEEYSHEKMRLFMSKIYAVMHDLGETVILTSKTLLKLTESQH